jgi:hypothetical protein
MLRTPFSISHARESSTSLNAAVLWGEEEEEGRRRERERGGVTIQ